MHTFYNFLIIATSFGLRIVSLFNNKMNLFIEGRKNVFEKLHQHIAPSDKTIWFHCASLGEFEQGVPIIEEIKKMKPDHKIVVSFFSPSGFEVKKNSPLADVVVYLPLDTPTNVKKFITAVHPSLAFFVKYEFWPNYLFELQKNNIPTILISGVFKERQIFFKSYGRFMRKALGTIDHFFVQEENSKMLLNSIGFQNVSISGDTRFDRVTHQLKADNNLQFVNEFKGNSLCIVCGSTWPEDEGILLRHINSSADNIKFIIASHKIETDKIEKLRSKIVKKTVLHSERNDVNLSEYSVLIIDCIGLLGKIYSYADVAYVGGAAGKTGLHNILEPATFGVPIIIGENYEDFPEAFQMKNHAALFSVATAEECSDIFTKLIEDPSFREQMGRNAGDFVRSNVGATTKIINYVSSQFDAL